ncbi:histidine phosphatase family protein [Leifsonia sp. NPDC058248]|uniref:histidine phosphatase family protein n=1 Tax=Leifsonia sp. NPDC058248 TaxID=3346402 RepID=UPI0036D9AFE0
MTRISLVRHGQTDWNLSKRIQGSSDIPLNDTGREQAESTGRALAGGSYDAIYASPLSRANETASIIARHTGLDTPLPLEAVAERRYGEAEGLTGSEILARWPEGTPVPGRESRDAVVERALPALLDLGEKHPGESIIVVSHGGVIGSLVRHVTGHALPGPGEVIPNGSVHEFVYDDGTLTLDRFNLKPEDRDLFTASVL